MLAFLTGRGATDSSFALDVSGGADHRHRGIGQRGLAHYGAALLDRILPREFGDLIAAPYRSLPALARRTVVALGFLGLAVVVVAGAIRITPTFQRYFESVVRYYERG